MLSSELEYCLNEAFQRSREERHEYITVEHLLLALLDVPQVIEILRACGADVGRDCESDSDCDPVSKLRP